MTHEEEMTNGFARIVLVQLNTDEQLNVREHEAIRVAIKSLEQQTCEDAVSRQAAINALKQAYWNKDIQNAKNDPCIVDAMTDWAIRTIKDLPPVKPQYTDDEIQKMQDLEQAEIQKAYELGKAEEPKTGHWKHNKCDVCGASRPPLFDYYCPNCGAMMEVEE